MNIQPLLKPNNFKLMFLFVLFFGFSSSVFAIPASATLTTPTGNITTNTPTYTWNTVSDATWYRLWTIDSTRAQKGKWTTASAAGCGSGELICSITPSITLAYGRAQWWIQTWNSSGYGDWSSTMRFKANPPSLPNVATLVSPTSVTLSHTPTYIWNAIDNATEYLLWVNDISGNPIQISYTSEQAACESGTGICAVTPTTPITGNGRWWVQARNDLGYGDWSSGRNFSILDNSTCITRENLDILINNNEDITQINTGCITNMRRLFKNNVTFNQDIGSWDVSSVENFHDAFAGATTFNQNISSWNVSSAIFMSNMFKGAKAFNQDISLWDISSVRYMRGMFMDASTFNQDISSWVVSSVIDMGRMFQNASVFDQDIGSWNVSSVKEMDYMFWAANYFNQDISLWNVGAVHDMTYMFAGAVSFTNHDLSAWDVSNIWFCNAEGFLEGAGPDNIAPAFAECF